MSLFKKLINCKLRCKHEEIIYVITTNSFKKNNKRFRCLYNIEYIGKCKNCKKIIYKHVAFRNLTKAELVFKARSLGINLKF